MTNEVFSAVWTVAKGETGSIISKFEDIKKVGVPLLVLGRYVRAKPAFVIWPYLSRSDPSSAGTWHRARLAMSGLLTD